MVYIPRTALVGILVTLVVTLSAHALAGGYASSHASQDASTGALILFAASDPAKFNTAAEILPLSFGTAACRLLVGAQ